MRSVRWPISTKGRAAKGRSPGGKAPRARKWKKAPSPGGRSGALSPGSWLWPAIGILVFAEVLLLGGHAVRWARTSSRFVLGEVKVVGHRRLSPESLVRLAGLAPGKNLFEVDLERIRRRIETSPWVRRSSVRKSPPSTIRIEIDERRPIALLEREGGMAVDIEGVILGPLPGRSQGCLPLLKGFAKKGAGPGGRIDHPNFGTAVAAAELFSGAPLYRGRCPGVLPAKNGRLRIQILDGRVNLLVSEEKLEAQAARFHAVAARIFDERNPSDAPVHLDLTFPGRIILRPANQDGGSEG